MSYAKLLSDVASASQSIRTATSIITGENTKTKFNNFANIVKNLGVAKSYRFEVSFDAPAFMATDVSNYPTVKQDISTITLLAESAQFPEFVLSTNQIHDQGQTRDFVYDKIYPPIVVTFICDGDMVVKQFFDSWVQGPIKDIHGTYRYRNQYTIPNMTISQLNDAGQVVYTVNLNEVFPKLINDVVVSAASRDFNRLQVQFVYKDWNSVGTQQARPKDDQIKKAMESVFGGYEAAQILNSSIKKIL